MHQTHGYCPQRGKSTSTDGLRQAQQEVNRNACRLPTPLSSFRLPQMTQPLSAMENTCWRAATPLPGRSPPPPPLAPRRQQPRALCQPPVRTHAAWHAVPNERAHKCCEGTSPDAASRSAPENPPPACRLPCGVVACSSSSCPLQTQPYKYSLMTRSEHMFTR